MKEQHGLTSETQGRVKRQFGNYDLIRRIDMGGMGEVYLAHQRTAFNREVAVKIIRDDLSRDKVARARFFREAEVSSHLKHEHILPMFEFGEVDGRLFMATPYISGGTLSQRLHAGPMSLTEVQLLFAALVQAVAYIHRRGIVHRDLKPSNILLDSEEVTEQVYVRLIDFGIASKQGDMASPPLTTAGHEMGTLAYMAPERLNGIAAPSNDIFSLGVILYQMLTGHLPGREAPSAPLPTPLIAVIQHCIAPNPEERYASASEVLHAFEQACQTLSASHSRSTALPPPVISPMASGLLTPSQPVPVEHSFELHSLGQVADIPATPPVKSESFGEADYAASTVDIGHAHMSAGVGTLERRNTAATTGTGSIPTAVPTGKRSSRRGGKRKNPLIAIIAFLIIIVLLVMAGMLFLSFPLIASANVNISPQAQSLQQIYTITAVPAQNSVDVAAASIPARGKTDSLTSSQSAQTTGQQCVLFIADCKHVVAPSDVENLSSQLQQTLSSQLSAQIDRELQAAHATEVGQKQFTTTSQSSNPDIGAEGQTVTVTVTEQGSVEYFKSTDAQQIARSLLTQQAQKLGKNFALLKATVQIGQPVVESVTDQGVVTLKVAAAGVAEYQFPAAELQVIPNQIKGMSLADARAYLRRLPGVDANAVSIHFTLGGGNLMPYSASQIHIIPINPTGLPSASLPNIPTPAVTPNDLTPTASGDNGQ